MEEKQSFQGRGILFSENSSLNRTELFWHYPHYHGSGWTPGAAIRQGNWKLIEFYETETVALYDLSVDISEENNLSEKHPKKVKELTKRLHQLQKKLNANSVSENTNQH